MFTGVVLMVLRVPRVLKVPASVAVERPVDLLYPLQDASREVGYAGEPSFLQQSDGPGASAPGFAVDDDLGGPVQLPQPPRQFAEWDELRTGDAADRRFQRLAHVEDHRGAAGVDARFQLAHRACRLRQGFGAQAGMRVA